MGNPATFIPTALCKVSCYKNDLKELTVIYIYIYICYIYIYIYIYKKEGGLLILFSHH